MRVRAARERERKKKTPPALPACSLFSTPPSLTHPGRPPWPRSGGPGYWHTRRPRPRRPGRPGRSCVRRKQSGGISFFVMSCLVLGACARRARAALSNSRCTTLARTGPALEAGEEVERGQGCGSRSCPLSLLDRPRALSLSTFGASTEPPAPARSAWMVATPSHTMPLPLTHMCAMKSDPPQARRTRARSVEVAAIPGCGGWGVAWS
jgi:hypothetical protein